MEKQMDYKRDFTGEAGCFAIRQKSIMFGVLLIAFGVFWLLKQLELLDPTIEKAVFSWQALVIGFGLIGIAGGKARIVGWMLLLVGSVFMLGRLEVLPADLSRIVLPVIVIAAGILTMVGAGSRIRKQWRVSGSDADSFDELTIFGGSERIISSPGFKGGEVVTIFGGTIIDLSQCQLAPGKHTIEMVTVFGGVTLIVPPDWHVRTEVVNVMGGFSDKRNLANLDPEKVLIVEGVAVFGGGEIKS